MSTTGTYSFNPSLGQITLYAFNMCGLRNTSLLQEHFESARMAANLICSNWSNRGVNLWAVDLYETTLLTDASNYDVDQSTVMILDAYITDNNGIDRLIMPISRSEYAALPNKEQVGFPTVFWFDRLVAPNITIWPVPDTSQGPVTLKYYRVRRVQDATLANGKNVEVPYLWLDAFANTLAARLAIIWAPERAQALKAFADETYQVAADQNVENVNVYISPQLSNYWRI